MAKKKTEAVQEVTKVKPKKTAKKKTEAVQEVTKVKPKKTAKKKTEEKPEAVHIYHTGDDLEKISLELTGKRFKIYAILMYSGLNMNTLKDGDILRWEV